MKHADNELLDKYISFIVIAFQEKFFNEIDVNIKSGGIKLTSVAGMARECIYDNKSEEFVIETLNCVHSLRDNLKRYYKNNCTGYIDWCKLDSTPTRQETMILIRWCKDQEAFLSRKLAFIRKRKALGLLT